MVLILVTGASGFIGSHVVDELLRQGYSVRGTVRSHNVPRVCKTYESFGDRFTTTVIDDLATSDLSQAVEGVDAIIHIAYPFAKTGSVQVVIETAVSFIVTSTISTLVATDDFWKEITITEKTYNPQTVEDALKPGAPGFLTYTVAKTLTDVAVRDLKRARPDLDLTTLHPSYVCGPLSRCQVYHSHGMATNRRIYELITGAPDRPIPGYDPAVRLPPVNVDVRDVARAHALALKVPPLDELKRFIVSSSTFTWSEAVELIAQARPELKGRLPVITGKEPAVPPSATLDTSATANILGLRNYVKWQDTVLDTIDDLLRVEKELAIAA